MNQVARFEWGFKGFVMSDAGAINFQVILKSLELLSNPFFVPTYAHAWWALMHRLPSMRLCKLLAKKSHWERFTLDS